MSLIHDALRKAAEENDQRSGQRDRPQSWRDVAPPPPPPSRAWLWMSLAAGAALGAAGLWWLAAWPAGPATPSPAPVPAAVVATAPAPATPEPTRVPAPPAPQPVAEERPQPAPPPPPPLHRETPKPEPPKPQPPPPVVPPPIATAPLPASAPAPPKPQPTSEAPPRMITPPAQTGQVGDDTYVLEAEVDGKQLRLDFIVWSAQPFAQINGRQVGVGQQVDGFLVAAISRDRVMLESPTRKLVLKVR